MYDNTPKLEFLNDLKEAKKNPEIKKKFFTIMETEDEYMTYISSNRMLKKTGFHSDFSEKEMYKIADQKINQYCLEIIKQPDSIISFTKKTAVQRIQLDLNKSESEISKSTIHFEDSNYFDLSSEHIPSNSFIRKSGKNPF